MSLTMRCLVALSVSLILGGCANFTRESVQREEMSAAMNRRPMRYSVLAPPDHDPEVERLPLIVFLHGGGDSDDAFDRHGISQRIHVAMREERIPRAVILLPDGGFGFWMNWYNGTRRYEDWVVEELIPRVSRRYNTLSCPEQCHVMGVSMGASGALRFALHRPDVFRSVTAISGPVMNTEQMQSFVTDRLLGLIIPLQAVFGPPEPRSRIEHDDVYIRWQDANDTGLEAIYIAWATGDRSVIVEGSRALVEHLEEHAIPHQSHEFEGGHNWVSWGPVIERSMRYVLGAL